MVRLILLRGLPASGKSTYARAWVSSGEKRIRSNRDDLRESLFGRSGVLSFEEESLITRFQRDTVTAAIKNGHDVIIDDMNLRAKYAREWATLAKTLGAEFEVIDFKTDREECIKRDAMRNRIVGREVITGIAKRFPMPWPVITPTEAKSVSDRQWEPYTHTPGLPEVAIFDLDGTLALNQGTRGWYDWSRVGEDFPNEYVVNLAKILFKNVDHIIYLSGRDSVCEDITLRWLDQHVPFGYHEKLFMRAVGDQRSDDVVKYELFNEHVRGQYNVSWIVDDRPKVCRLWRAMGLPLLQVGTGEEF